MASPVSHTCGSWLLLLAAFLIQPVSAQAPQQQIYLISTGTAAEVLSSGTLWLYSYSWYGLQKFELARIHNGLAVVPLDPDRLRREMNPHPNTTAYVVVIQAGEHRWYRTRGISPDDFWADLPGAIRSLGQAGGLATGDTRLILPPLAKRRITLHDPTGRPRAGTSLTVSVYLWDDNHCAVHEGLPLGTFRTGSDGTIELLAPLVPLYLDGLHYFEEAGSGPAGRAYSRNIGMKIGADENVVVRAAWQISRIAVELQVLTRAGQPRPHVDIYGNWNTNTCGGFDKIAETDAQGTVRLDLDATFTALTLMTGGPYAAGDPEAEKNTRKLTGSELRELLSTRRLTIVW